MISGLSLRFQAIVVTNSMDWALQRRNNTALASNVVNSRLESLFANSGDVYNPRSDHLAGGLVQQGLSVAMGIAPCNCFGGATDKRYSLRHELEEHMKIIRTIFIAAVLSCSVQLSYSADANGRYIYGGGAGGVTCPQFVASMEKARSLGIGSLGYVNETQGFTMYLLGFQTGYNTSTKDTCDIFPGEEKNYPLLSWAENFCRANPSNLFANAVVALSIDRYSKRQRVCSK